MAVLRTWICARISRRIPLGLRRLVLRDASGMTFRFVVALLCACGSSALRSGPAGGDVAKELASAIKDIAAKVALEDGYGEEFASAFVEGVGASAHASDRAIPEGA